MLVWSLLCFACRQCSVLYLHLSPSNIEEVSLYIRVTPSNRQEFIQHGCTRCTEHVYTIVSYRQHATRKERSLKAESTRSAVHLVYMHTYIIRIIYVCKYTYVLPCTCSYTHKVTPTHFSQVASLWLG